MWRKEIKRKKLKNISYHDTCKKNAITDDAYNALDMRELGVTIKDNI